MAALQHHEKIDGSGYPLGLKESRFTFMLKSFRSLTFTAMTSIAITSRISLYRIEQLFHDHSENLTRHCANIHQSDYLLNMASLAA